MSSVLNTLRYIFISPELLVCVFGFFLHTFLPDQLLWLSERIGTRNELLKYFGLLPAGLIVYDLSLVKNILMPDSDKRSDFQKWELYEDFKLGCTVGLLYALFFCAGGVICLFFEWSAPQAYQSALLSTSVIGSLMVSAILYADHIRIEELFRKHSRPTP